MLARRDLRRTRRAAVVTGLLLVAAVGLAPPDSARPAAGRTAVAVAEDRGVRAVGMAAPTVIPRSEWDPTGTCPASDGRRTAPRRVHLHHTHRPVVERPAEVAGALRAVCGVHRRRGFDDLGYHYAIDPFGRIWQGRGPLPADMPDRVRQGAHAQGFNRHSIGVVLIGDLDAAPPTAAARQATVDLLAFLADRYGLDAGATVETTSTGGPATRHAAGAEVALPTIAGHRDTADTTCPGEHLYALLPDLRRAVAARLTTPAG